MLQNYIEIYEIAVATQMPCQFHMNDKAACYNFTVKRNKRYRRPSVMKKKLLSLILALKND